MRPLLLVLLMLATHAICHSQSIGIGTTAPNSSAQLDISSVSKGILIPRMTSAQRLGISSPATGLLVFDTDTNCFWFYAGVAWSKMITNASGWLLNGNTGINPGSFIGTTDNQPIIFRTNSQLMGSLGKRENIFFGLSSGLFMDTLSMNNIGIGSYALMSNKNRSHIVAIGQNVLRYNGIGATNIFDGTENTGVGDNAMTQDSTGSRNCAFGSYALTANATGSYNVAVGARALTTNTIASSNTAVGAFAMEANTEGYSNTAVGESSLASNTTGMFNVSIGAGSLYGNISGHDNTAVGNSALVNHIWGDHNTSIGSFALYGDTSGSFNTSVGSYSLNQNRNGTNNTAIGTSALAMSTNQSNLVAVGDQALYNNGQGAISAYQSIGNTAVGSKSLFANTTGYNNTANGFNSLYSNTTGDNNTSIGYQTLLSNTTGLYNTGTGSMALYTNATGGFNTAIGAAALYSNTSGGFNTANGSSALGSNTIGSYNSANGYYSLAANLNGNSNVADGYFALRNTVGSANVGIGSNSLQTNTTGFSNTGVGYFSNVGSAGLTNATAIGSYAQVNCDNCMVLGSINGVNGATSDVNVGIGVTTPQQRLSLKNGMNIDQTDQNAGTFDNNVLRFGNNSGEAISSSRSGPNNLWGLDFYTGATKRMVITHDGNVGIGINNPNVPLSFPAFLGKKITLYPGATGDVGFAVQGNQLLIYADNPNAMVRLGYDQAGTFTNNLDVFGNGNATLRGTLTQNSDIRLKKNISVIQPSLTALLQLNAYRYQWKDPKMDSSTQIGLIAQEVQKQFPELVKENANGELSVNYSGMIPLMLNAMKEMEKQIQELKDRIKTLEKQK